MNSSYNFLLLLKEALIEGAADPALEQWDRTTDEEQLESGIGSWHGVTVAVS